MSLSNPTQKNPATKFIDWSGSKGKFKYYDKTNEENVFFEKPIFIIPLDDLSTIKGYDSQNNCGFYSNEVKYLDKEILTVKSFKGGMVARGLYKDLKLPTGCKFSKSVYAAMITGNKENTKIELVNFQLYGSGIGAWIDARINIDSGEIIELSSSNEELTKGTTVYYSPRVKKIGKRADILAKCIELDRELQKYLNDYLNKSKDFEHEGIKQKEIMEGTLESKEKSDDFNDVDDLPF